MGLYNTKKVQLIIILLFAKGYLWVIMQPSQKTMGDLPELMRDLVQFRDARDWKQFHNPKDLSAALAIEAGELQELYLWKNGIELDEVDQVKVAEELADVFSFALLLAHHYGFDLKQIVQDKIAKNDEKYPVEKARGSAKKYDEL